jgi:hypothetical protein
MQGMKMCLANRFLQTLPLFVFVAGCLETTAEPALRGKIETRDGNYYEGTLRFENQEIILPGPAGERKITALNLKIANLWLEGGEPLASISRAKNGLHAFYFNSPDLSGKAVHRIDPLIDNPWRGRPPSPDFNEGRFSVRWEGEVAGPLTGKVTFQPFVDDGVRLWIDGQLLVDQWRAGSSQVKSEYPMEKGKLYPIRMEYYQGGGGLQARLAWSGPGLSHQPIPQAKFFTSADVAIPLYSGIILKGGSFLAGVVKRMTRTEVEICTSGPDVPPLRIFRVYIAAVIFDSSDPSKLTSIEDRKSGCLLRTGDYMESSDLSIQEGKVLARSFLLGRRTFLQDEVPIIKLASHQIAPAKFEVRTRSGSILRVNALTLDADKSRCRITLQSGEISTVHGIIK